MPYSHYLPEHMGSIALSPPGPFVAGSLRRADARLHRRHVRHRRHRHAEDLVADHLRHGKPQFDKPQAANFTTVEASNGAVLEVWFDRTNIRPWQNTIMIRVGRGYLRAGRHADDPHRRPAAGLAGLSAADQCRGAMSSCDPRSMRSRPTSSASCQQPAFDLVAGPAASWKAILPSLAVAGEPFRLALVAEDMWGNPTDKADAALALEPSRPVRGLPSGVTIKPGEGPRVIENLVVEHAGRCRAEGDGRRQGSRARQSDARRRRARRSAATGPTCTARAARPSAWARRKPISATRATAAFVDMVGHQGNDFQITDAFWKKLNELTAEFDKPGQVRLPAGLRMVRQHRHGRRPQHLLSPRRPADPPLVAHPGRGPDLDRGDLHRRQAVRVAQGRGLLRHRPCRRPLRRSANTPTTARPSAPSRCIRRWGTFEWLLHDAFEQGLPRRRGLPQRRPQGPARRDAARRLDLRRDRRLVLLLHAGADARRAVRRRCASASTTAPPARASSSI